MFCVAQKVFCVPSTLVLVSKTMVLETQKMVANLETIFWWIRKMIAAVRKIFSFEKNIVSGIEKMACATHIIFSTTEIMVRVAMKTVSVAPTMVCKVLLSRGCLIVERSFANLGCPFQFLIFMQILQRAQAG